MLAILCRAVPEPRRAALRGIHDRAGALLDRALVLWLPGPGSYTGEHSAELHLHGGRAVLDGVSEALADLGARPAEPGEFTRRAFENGKLDLIEIEGLGDLLDAETENQRRQALARFEGGLSQKVDGWRDQLLDLRAEIAQVLADTTGARRRLVAQPHGS